MNQNPYAPPRAEVADISVNDAHPGNTPVFFPCSLLKLAVMSLSTLGLYHIFWFYKNWRYVKDRTGEDITPVARSIFSILFCYSLFKRVRECQDKGSRKPLAAGPLATVFILMNITAQMPGIFWSMSLVSFAPLLLVQREINEINHVQAPDHDNNARFTGWNWTGIVIAVVLWTIVIIGLNVDTNGG